MLIADQITGRPAGGSGYRLPARARESATDASAPQIEDDRPDPDAHANPVPDVPPAPIAIHMHAHLHVVTPAMTCKWRGTGNRNHWPGFRRQAIRSQLPGDLRS